MEEGERRERVFWLGFAVCVCLEAMISSSSLDHSVSDHTVFNSKAYKKKRKKKKVSNFKMKLTEVCFWKSRENGEAVLEGEWISGIETLVVKRIYRQQY